MKLPRTEAQAPHPTDNGQEAEAQPHTASEPLETSETTNFLQKYPIGKPLTNLDAADVRSLFRSAYDWLAHNYEQVNHMNVFPVPDGDTGTNMLLTIKSAWATITARGGDTAGSVMEAAAEGAHHGSRGNSGVILGQLFQGFSQALNEKSHLTVHDLAEALRHGSEVAYASVPAPVEGTILTVSREAGAAAAKAAAKTKDLRELLRQVVEEADASVGRTPELLPVLAKAGVVDSGGKGLYYVLEGMYRALMGEPTATDLEHPLAAVADAEIAHQINKGKRELPPITWGFDVQFLVEKPNRSVADILTDISAMGDCPLVEGDENLVKVHIHVFDPGVAVSYGVQLGFMTDVVVENMDDMAAMAQIGEEDVAAATPATPFSVVTNGLDEEGVGLVAVAPGEGFAEIFHSLGVHGVVRGGQTMNPSVADLAEVIQRLPSRRVLILPNNSNVLMAANQAAKAVQKEDKQRQVAVVATKTLPQGIAALMGYDPGIAKLKKLVGQMEAEMEHVQTGEVTQAVRDAQVDELDVHIGDIIGIHNGKLVHCGGQVNNVVLELLARMVTDDTGVITLYHGDFVAQRAAENLAEQVQAVYPELDVEMATGGQPHYFYILSAE